MLYEIDDVLINKIDSIKRCVARAREEYGLARGNFKKDFSRQDAAILNITRACEQTIDLANHVIRVLSLKTPNSSGESFELLLEHQIIDESLCKKMKNMVHFRNLAIHQYGKLNIEIVESIINTEIDELLNFSDLVLAQKKRIETQGLIRKVRFDDPNRANEFEIQQLNKAIFAVYQYYQAKKSETLDFLNHWRKYQLLSAAQNYNSKSYSACMAALELFFAHENSIARENNYSDLQKIPDKDFEEYFREIQS